MQPKCYLLDCLGLEKLASPDFSAKPLRLSRLFGPELSPERLGLDTSELLLPEDLKSPPERLGLKSPSERLPPPPERLLFLLVPAPWSWLTSTFTNRPLCL